MAPLISSRVILVKWLDNNAVHIASNDVGVKPLGFVERCCAEEKKKKQIQCPQLILRYNKGMGGFDKADQLISLYRIKIKTKRWHIKIFWHLVDMAKLNAWLLYRRHCEFVYRFIFYLYYTIVNNLFNNFIHL